MPHDGPAGCLGHLVVAANAIRVDCRVKLRVATTSNSEFPLTSAEKPAPRFSHGLLRLFRVRGIDVFLHWTWIILAIYEIQGDNRYSQPFWRAIEYVTIFGIVLLHEFGHTLACRQVGGTANRIVLWPLGGIAYVNPPPRPWPYLWSILAGPLVNLVLVPVLFGVLVLSVVLGWRGAFPDADQFLFMICFTNLVMLVFNLLPVFPLDGGQILRGLLWLVIGRAASLMVAAILGFVVALGMIAVSLHWTEWWLALMAFLGAIASVSGLRRAMLIMSSRKAARYEDHSCPKCGHGAPVGKFFSCAQCSRRFDAFKRSSCPQCGRLVNEVLCLECERSSPIQEWGSERARPEPSLPSIGAETCASIPSPEDENRK